MWCRHLDAGLTILVKQVLKGSTLVSTALRQQALSAKSQHLDTAMCNQLRWPSGCRAYTVV